MQFDTAADILPFHVARSPDRIAHIFEGAATTFGMLDRHARRVANGLIAEGVGRGGRIAVLARNSDAYVECLHGAFKARAVVVGLNWRLAPPEITHILADAGAELLFVDHDLRTVVDALRDRLPHIRRVISLGHDDPAGFRAWRDGWPATAPDRAPQPEDTIFQPYTSGTTGRPKGVPVTSRTWLALVRQLHAGDYAVLEPGTINMMVCPLFHVAGLNSGLVANHGGATNVIEQRLDPASLLQSIERYRVNTIIGITSLLSGLANHPAARDHDLSSLRWISYGGAPITEGLLRRAQDVLGCDLMNAYGMTETCGPVVLLSAADHRGEALRLKATGRPLPGVSLKIVDADGEPLPPGRAGEIMIAGPSVMRGYWNRPEATQAAFRDGWLRTGDIGSLDQAGYLTLHDRLNDLIISGDENVYPTEVENALATHPAVKEVAVIGVPDPRWGEAVRAIVVLRDETQGTAADLIAHARQLIAGYKVPKAIDFAEQLPRNATGKLLRSALKQQYCA